MPLVGCPRKPPCAIKLLPTLIALVIKGFCGAFINLLAALLPSSAPCGTTFSVGLVKAPYIEPSCPTPCAIWSALSPVPGKAATPCAAPSKPSLIADLVAVPPETTAPVTAPAVLPNPRTASKRPACLSSTLPN